LPAVAIQAPPIAAAASCHQKDGANGWDAAQGACS
jgi:hypothetical protein